MDATNTTIARPRLAEYVALTKPGIVTSNVLTAACGLWLATEAAGLARTLGVLAGTALLVAGCGALNMLLERRTDRLMDRTRLRPLADGRTSRLEALLVGLIAVVAGLSVLAVLTPPVTALCGALAAAVYVGVYTPMKRLSPWAIPVGAVSGALPPVMGWTAATGRLDAALGGTAALLFVLLFVWQIPHFAGIAIYRADDYRQAGLRIFPPAHRTAQVVWGTRLLAVVQTAVVVGLAWQLGLGPAFLAPTLLGCLIMAAAAGRPATDRIRWARTVFLASLGFLPLFALGVGLSAII